MKLFGFEIKRPSDNPNTAPSFVEREIDDGALSIAPAAAYGMYVDLDGSVRSEAQLIARYREMANHHEVDNAIDDIVNEAIVQESDIKTITLNLDNTTFSDPVKETIRAEFDYILGLLRFNTFGYDVFRRWYIDGRLYYHVVIDPQKPLEGIKDLRYIDPRKMRKVKETQKGPASPQTPLPVIQYQKEYFIYNSKGFGKVTGNANISQSGSEGVKIAKDAIVYVTSGVLDKNHTTIVSHLHKAIKPLNMLRSLEDAVVIYRISRAPERRIFYIDVGNLPKIKAEQYLNDIMLKFKNKLVYNADDGSIKDDRKFMSMLEDFWLPRREGGRGTEISTLPAGQNLGELEDVKYFQRKLYKSLNVPEGRLESNQLFSIGRGQEISRDEVKFTKFINRLRARFSEIFIQSLEKQLILKGIVLPDEWDNNSQKIKIDYQKDNLWAELKETEITNSRLDVLDRVEPYQGVYYTKRWVQENVLKLSEDQIKKMDADMMAEAQAEIQKQVDIQILQAQAQQQLIKAGIEPVEPADMSNDVKKDK